MKTPAWRFWAVLVATAVTMGVTASLGLWQMGRAAQKQALFEQIETRSQLPALPNASLTGREVADEWLHRRVRLQGRWVPQHTVFLDNRQMNGQPGFYVVPTWSPPRTPESPSKGVCPLRPPNYTSWGRRAGGRSGKISTLSPSLLRQG